MEKLFIRRIFLILGFLFGTYFVQSQTSKVPANKWFPVYDFETAQFQKPAQKFGPFARWWWPGNDVTKQELQREINLFADHAFGGVEIQTLSLFVPMLSAEVKERVLSWDSPEYYGNVATVMKEAQKRGLTVDMTNGSGWPTGGSYLLPEDGFLNLAYASKDIVGGKLISTAVPFVENTTGVPSKLQAVLAVKARSEQADGTKTILLDASSTQVLTANVKNDTLHWDAPAGNWKIIAFWSKPQSTGGSMTASSKQGPVLDHLDSLKVIKNYDYLFGNRTGLQPYFGNPMRAIFTDSYEFAVDRHYSVDFLSFFKKQRGYDATLWLPANMQKGYNYASFKNPNAAPDFSFGSEDWRLRYDYDLTLSELLEENFIKTSSRWTEKRGLLFRTQAYGMNMDMIANAGHASIPETESMLGPEAILKIMASGAHLYNRLVLSSESVVFSGRAYMTTPQKIRLAVDKLFSAGVNQIIYHGVPYRYTTGEIMPAGWYPFGNMFSSNLGEGNIFWKYQKEINEYIGRTQYALRSGKPRADVLIYFPFMNVDGMPYNPGEILTKGYMEGIEPPFPNSKAKPLTASETEKEIWAGKVYPVINLLEANGITWDWVNDASIQEAKLDRDKQINIRGNRYQALILPDISVIQLKTAKQISALAKNGMNFLVTGTIPTKQPSFLNWEINDKLTAREIAAALKCKNSVHTQNPNALAAWLKTLNLPVKFKDKYTFTRQVQREMSDGSRIQFIWNKSDAWQLFSLVLDKKYKNACWLNAETGLISAADLQNVTYTIPPYTSIILYASTNNQIASELLSKPEPIVYQAKEVFKIEKWDVSSDSVSVKYTSLFDWKNNEQFKFSSGEGLYRSTFQLNEVVPQAAYFIDLGKVFFTAEVVINGRSAGKRIYSPYSLNVTNLLRPGENTIEVRVTPGQLNGFIGEAERGNKLYSIFRRNTGLMSSGMVGPVILYQKDRN